MWGGGGSRRGPMVKSKKTTVFKVPEGGGGNDFKEGSNFFQGRVGWGRSNCLFPIKISLT